MANPTVANVGLIVGTLFALIGIVLATVSIATNEWVRSLGSKQGLWRNCPAQDSCSDIGDGTRDLRAVRATMIIGDSFGGLTIAAAVILLACVALREIRGRWITPVIAALSFFAFLFTLIGVCVYQGEIYEDLVDSNRGYSFWLGVVAIIVFGIATIFFVLSIVLYEMANQGLRKRNDKQVMVEREREKHFVQPYYNDVITPYLGAPRPVVYERSYDAYQSRHTRPRAVDYPMAAVPVYPMYRDYYSQDGLNVYNYGDAGVVNPSALRYSYDPLAVHKSRGYQASSRRARDAYGYPLNYIRDA